MQSHTDKEYISYDVLITFQQRYNGVIGYQCKVSGPKSCKWKKKEQTNCHNISNSWFYWMVAVKARSFFFHGFVYFRTILWSPILNSWRWTVACWFLCYLRNEDESTIWLRSLFTVKVQHVKTPTNLKNNISLHR